MQTPDMKTTGAQVVAADRVAPSHRRRREDTVGVVQLMTGIALLGWMGNRNLTLTTEYRESALLWWALSLVAAAAGVALVGLLVRRSAWALTGLKAFGSALLGVAAATAVVAALGAADTAGALLGMGFWTAFGVALIAAGAERSRRAESAEAQGGGATAGAQVPPAVATLDELVEAARRSGMPQQRIREVVEQRRGAITGSGDLAP